MKKFINLSILFIFLILAVSCKKENFSKKDFAGYWENFSILKSDLLREPENPKTLFASVYTESKMVFSFTENGTYKKQIQNKITKLDLDKAKAPENFSTEKLKSFAQKNQTDGGDFSIKKSFLILEPYYQIQNDEIQDFEKIIPIKLNFEFSQDKKELTLTFADNQKIILKKIESNNLN
ncbi:hypothetical protein [Treponema berlinense]|uniref:hypothetical protein n=2 Tax=Treponema berlinense TaxID=225004 RepID=UPI00235361CC|nr:hypothetical protein [Treponema berlinense]MDD5835061.1 hypothetical protein [Treponema berlinense]MDY3708337.1 hypothetical protein [Treponema berlinense]